MTVAASKQNDYIKPNRKDWSRFVYLLRFIEHNLVYTDIPKECTRKPASESKAIVGTTSPRTGEAGVCVLVSAVHNVCFFVSQHPNKTLYGPVYSPITSELR
jgi:hypothetical protein